MYDMLRMGSRLISSICIIKILTSCDKAHTLIVSRCYLLRNLFLLVSLTES